MKWRIEFLEDDNTKAVKIIYILLIGKIVYKNFINFLSTSRR